MAAFQQNFIYKTDSQLDLAHLPSPLFRNSILFQRWRQPALWVSDKDSLFDLWLWATGAAWTFQTQPPDCTECSSRHNWAAIQGACPIGLKSTQSPSGPSTRCWVPSCLNNYFLPQTFLDLLDWVMRPQLSAQHSPLCTVGYIYCLCFPPGSERMPPGKGRQSPYFAQCLAQYQRLR